VLCAFCAASRDVKYDILTLQSQSTKRHINLRFKHSKNCFIHGVEGVLKAELDFLLGRYDNIDFQRQLSKIWTKVLLRFISNKTVNKMRAV
jgi:hypothetical protein